MLTTNGAGRRSVVKKYIMLPLLLWLLAWNQQRGWKINDTKQHYFVHNLGYIFLRVVFLNKKKNLYLGFY